ncbi:class I SAM-dependent methyltransferase [Nocardioides sp.]|uniref:class I SAM-dependent methyltransferase n=1 Tax=Nocardioides sp. TaxID=35761 RepID=UPI002ECFB785
MNTPDKTRAPDAFDRFEADGWEHRADGYHQLAAGLTTRVVERLLDAAEVDHDEHVLDVATGPGYVAAAAMGRGAHVVGVDIAAAMVTLARTLRPEIEFRQADAERLPFAEDSFDAVLGNFLILHVGSPERVIAELTRVLRPGGRVALSTWDVPERARLLGVLVDALADVGAEPPADLPVGPPFFRFADDSEFAALLSDAGLVDVEVQTVGFTQGFASDDHLWESLIGGTVRTRALVLAQPDSVQAEIRTAFDRRVRPYATDRGLDVPVSVKLASGRKPR